MHHAYRPFHQARGNLWRRLANQPLTHRRPGSPVLAALAALLVAAPPFLPPFDGYILTEVLVFGLFALSFDIIFGHTGLIHFGTSSFFGMGCYGFLLPIVKLGLGFWGSLCIAVAVSVAFALCTGLVVTRFKRHYFLVFTIIISMILFLLAMNLRWFTGGDEGYTITVPRIPLGFTTLAMDHPLVRYYVVLAFVSAVFFMVRRFL